MHNRVSDTLVSGMIQTYNLNPPIILLADAIQHDPVYSENHGIQIRMLIDYRI